MFSTFIEIIMFFSLYFVNVVNYIVGLNLSLLSCYLFLPSCYLFSVCLVFFQFFFTPFLTSSELIN